MAQKPRNMMFEARPKDSAALMPRPAPMMTIPVLMYSSGRAASFIRLASPGKKLPMIRPRIRARMKPNSPLMLIAQGMPNFTVCSLVAAM